jgi:hypothetical protein
MIKEKIGVADATLFFMIRKSIVAVLGYHKII